MLFSTFHHFLWSAENEVRGVLPHPPLLLTNLPVQVSNTSSYQLVWFRSKTTGWGEHKSRMHGPLLLHSPPVPSSRGKKLASEDACPVVVLGF